MNYRHSFICLILIHLMFFNQVLFRGEVIFPHANDFEMTGLPAKPDRYVANRKFSDQSSAYIPEIHQHLNGRAYHWISTWNPSVQLGRPTFQLGAFGKAYPITHILSGLTKNPFRLYAILTVLTILLTGIFFFLYLVALQLSPIACLVASLGLSLGIYVSYWLTFIMFISTLCWSAGLLWLTTKFIRKRHIWSAVGISFATYNLLISGYPQFTILCAYIIAIQGVVSCRRYWVSWQDFLTKGILLIGVVISGVIAALPVYFDLILNAQRSARLAVSDSFFLAVLPQLKNLTDLGLFLTTIVDPFLYGLPIDQSYPITFWNQSSFYNGLSLSPLYFCLLILSFQYALFRKLWYWHLFAILCCIGSLYPPAYLFAVHSLGFRLSRTVLLSGSIIAALILVAHTIDFLLSQRPSSAKSTAILPMTLLMVAVNCTGIWISFKESLPFHWSYFCFNALAIGGLFFWVHQRYPWLLLSLTIATVFLYGNSLILARPITEIQTTSSLIAAIRQEISDQNRFAIMGADLSGVFPANQESLLQLKSIHSYDSLSSKQYQKMVAKWSEAGSNTYGRLFSYLDRPDKIVNSDFRLSGVGLILSKSKLNTADFTQVNEVNGIKLYRPRWSPILMRQTQKPEAKDTTQSLMMKEPMPFQPVLLRSWDDYQEIQVGHFSQITQLFISQQYHPQWQAFSGKTPLQTMEIDQFYQGVVIPPNTEKVTLKFMPTVLWSWVPQVIYLGIGVSWIIYSYLRKIRSKSHPIRI